MRSMRYLNTVLTILAVLLTLNLWTQWTATPGGRLLWTAQEAHAAEPARGLPNAAQQRRETVQQLKQLNTEVRSLKQMFASGQARVRLEAAPQKK